MPAPRKKRKRVILCIVLLIITLVIPNLCAASSQFTDKKLLSTRFFQLSESDISGISVSHGPVGYDLVSGTPECQEFIDALNHAHFIFWLPGSPVKLAGGRNSFKIYYQFGENYTDTIFEWFNFGSNFVKIGNCYFFTFGSPFAKWIQRLETTPYVY